MVYSRCSECSARTYYCEVHFEDQESPTLLSHTPKCIHNTPADSPQKS